jgi:hypothetical protein
MFIEAKKKIPLPQFSKRKSDLIEYISYSGSEFYI